MRSTPGVFIAAALLVLAAPGAFARDSTPLPTDAAYHKAFKEAILAGHNAYRAKHGVPALKWDDKIAEYARSRAASRSQSEGLSAGHSGLQGYGENLHWAATSQATPPSATNAAKQAVDSWYSEIANYNYANASSHSGTTGHFTQVVWKSTTSIGCAVHNLKGSQWPVETYVVCNYSPPGNYGGQYQRNVLPRK